jgi:hypothetical protein
MERRAIFSRINSFFCVFLLTVGLFLAAPTIADPLEEPQWSHNVYLGLMTSNKADELVTGPDVVGQQLFGYALAYDRPIGARWSVGFEVQATYHFGDQTYGEFGLPLTVRYRPAEPWIPTMESMAFGLGMSHTTEIPDIEVRTRGGSRRDLIYWMLEAEFETGSPDLHWFFRIHHRSDAWGTLKPEGGSNALAIGLRKTF